MKILHTSDWHLGKVFHEHSLLEDQSFFLKQIIRTLTTAEKQNEPYDALIIAGDIYDRAVPPPEAVTLLSDFLTTVNSKFSSLHVFLISGNHDSPDRLSFAAEILNASKIHIVTNVNKLTSPIILGKDFDKTAFYPIPFLTPGKIQNKENDEDSQIRSQQELLSEAIKRIRAFNKKNLPNIQTCAIAHSFITSAQVGTSERRFIGDVDSVSTDIFSSFTYTALGHIHKFQQIKNNPIFYSGAPLVYAFDDFKNETIMISAILKNNKLVSCEKINLTPLHKVVRLEGKFNNFYGITSNKDIAEENKNNYIEFVLKGLSGIENPIGLLRQKYPFVLSIKRADSISNKTSNIQKSFLSNNSKNKTENLFDDFINDIYDGKRNLSDLDYIAEKKVFMKLAKQYSWE